MDEGPSTRGPFYLQPADPVQAADLNYLSMLGIKGGFSHIVPPDARPTCKEGTAASCADWVDPDAPIALAIETEACNHRILSYCDSGHEQYKKFFWIEHRIGDKYTGLTSGSAVFVYSASYQYEYSMVTSPTTLHYTGR